MVLARSIMSENGDLLLAAGFEINDRVKNKLETIELPFVWIFEEGTEMVVPEELISEQISLQTISSLKKNSELIRQVAQVKELTADQMKEVMAEPAKFKNMVSAERIKRSVQEILDSIMGRDSAVINLNSIRSKNGFLFQHSLDVTITSIMMANKLMFNRFELEELAIGTLLMDIGMVVLPDQIVNKTGRLTYNEFTFLKEHPNYGWTILRENNQIPLTSAHIAYQHHERQDGAGYPRRLKGTNEPPSKTLNRDKGYVHRYAEIASVADAYVSLINPRPGVLAKTPEETMRALIQSAGTQLNRSIVDLLITMIPIYPVGSRVVVIEDQKYKLRGFTGVVAKANPDQPNRPIVILLQDLMKRKIKPKAIDLASEKDMQIQFVPLR